jgi:rod shape-determining protein MreC
MRGATRLFLIFFFLSLLLFFKFPKGIIHNVLVKTVYTPILMGEAYLEEIERVKQERNILIKRVSQLEEELRKLRGERIVNLWKENVEGITAEVLAFDPIGIPTKIILDKGKRDGVKYGIPVLAMGYLAGRITSVGDNISEALTLYNPELRISVFDGRSGILGIVEGGREPSLSYIPEGSDIREGDTLYTSGIGGVFPRGIPVGVIEEISEPSKDPLFLTIKVSPLYNYSKRGVFQLKLN